MTAGARVYLGEPGPAQLDWVAENLRPEDQRELAALYGVFEPGLARQLLADSLDKSVLAFAICAGAEPLALTGLVPLAPAQAALLGCAPQVPEKPVAAHAPWLLGTAAIARHRQGFMRASREALRHYQSLRTPLCNAVEAGQIRSCRYLAALGFQLGPPRPLGGGLFRNFKLEV